MVSPRTSFSPNIPHRRRGVSAERWCPDSCTPEQTHNCKLTKVTGISRLLDSNQGLRVPIRGSHCAWVYREYNRGGVSFSPRHRNAPTKSRGADLLPPAPERHLSRPIMRDSLISRLRIPVSAAYAARPTVLCEYQTPSSTSSLAVPLAYIRTRSAVVPRPWRHSSSFPLVALAGPSGGHCCRGELRGITE